MKVKFIKETRVQYNGAKSFSEGREIDLPQDIAQAQVRAKNAVEMKAEKEKPKKEAAKKEEPKVEVKQLKTKREDKQLKTSDKEDK